MKEFIKLAWAYLTKADVRKIVALITAIVAAVKDKKAAPAVESLHPYLSKEWQEKATIPEVKKAIKETTEAVVAILEAYEAVRALFIVGAGLETGKRFRWLPF